jgi:hypothetical protein
VAEVPRNAESLCNFVRSTAKLVAFSGIFTLVPVEDVSVMVFTSTTKERRLVLGGGVSGAAVNVKLRVAVPPPPGVDGFFGPLQAAREIADMESSEARTFRKFMSPHGDATKPKLIKARAFQVQLYARPLMNSAKTRADCSTANH